MMYVWLLGIRKEGFNIRQGRAKRILDKGGMFQRTFNTILQWSQERVDLLFNMQAFSWASHLKHWILKMIVWHEMVRGEENNKDLKHKVKDLRSERDFELSMLQPPA